MEDIGSVHFRLRPIDSTEVHLFRADVEVEGATIWIIVHRETGQWPYKLVNDSDYDFVLFQTVRYFALGMTRYSLSTERRA